MMMAVVLAPGGISPHHGPAAPAVAQAFANMAERETHGHHQEEIDRPADSIAGAHEHHAADNAHDTSVLTDGIAAPIAELRPRWAVQRATFVCLERKSP
jgi:hypothetical protein